METIKKILQIAAYESVHEMPVETRIEVFSDGFMDLTIEKIGDDRLSVAHYFEQNMDLMSDPEIVFDISGDDWTPIRYTQHPSIHRHDETGLQDVDSFVSQWDENLKVQGFIDAATRGDYKI